MVRFLQSADWQLGMTRHFLTGEAQARFSAARLDVIEQMGNLAVDEGCQFVVVCGDVFDSNQVERQVLMRAFEKMAAFPQVTFYLLPGNHDPLDASSIYRSQTFTMHQPENVKVLDESSPVEAVPGVELIPAPWTNKYPTIDLVDAVCEGLEATDAVRIIVGHGAADTMSPSRDDPKLIGLKQLEEKINAGLIHYVALGDRHSTTDVGTTGRVWYAGAPEPTNYTEINPGNVLVVDLDADNISVEAKHLGTWRFVNSERYLSADEDIDALEEWLSTLNNKDRTIVKVSLTGQVSLAQKARLDSILDHNADLLAALETWERRSDLVVIPDNSDLEYLGMSGFAHDALLELQKMAESGDNALIARDALTLLHRLVGPRA